MLGLLWIAADLSKKFNLLQTELAVLSRIDTFHSDPAEAIGLAR
jgi:hypothetical protein